MTETEAKTWFLPAEMDLVNDLIIWIRTGGGPVRRGEMEKLIRRVLVSRRRLLAYCRLLIERGADRIVGAVDEEVAERVLGNRLEELEGEELLKLGANLDGLSILHEMIFEEPGEAWKQVMRDNRSAAGEEVAVIPPQEFAGLVGVRFAGGTAKDASGAAMRWILRTGREETLALPTGVSERCYGVPEMQVRLFFEVHDGDRASGKCALRAAVKPAPQLDGYELVLHLPGGEEAVMSFEKSELKSIYSDYSGPVNMDWLPVGVAKMRIEFR
jgi:hypothetical protein